MATVVFVFLFTLTLLPPPIPEAAVTLCDWNAIPQGEQGKYQVSFSSRTACFQHWNMWEPAMHVYTLIRDKHSFLLGLRAIPGSGFTMPWTNWLTHMHARHYDLVLMYCCLILCYSTVFFCVALHFYIIYIQAQYCYGVLSTAFRRKCSDASVFLKALVMM